MVRPCEPDDVMKCLDRLYRQRRIDLIHARIMRIWGERGIAPDPRHLSERGDCALWREAMDRLEWPLRVKGIVAGIAARPDARTPRARIIRLAGPPRDAPGASASQRGGRPAGLDRLRRRGRPGLAAPAAPRLPPLLRRASRDEAGWTVLEPLSGRLLVARARPAGGLRPAGLLPPRRAGACSAPSRRAGAARSACRALLP